MAEGVCPNCGGALEAGFVSTSNGSGLFWSLRAEERRLRPKDMEVLVPTEFGGTYSANLPGQRCRKCKTILLKLP
ncbi:MAG: PF20097 family protein [Thermoplasmata archaeon]